MPGYIEWNVSPYLFQFGDVRILRWYGLFFITGFIIGFHLLKKIYIREGYNTDNLNVLLWYIIAGTIIGARLGHCLFYQPDLYLADPIRILKFWEGGLASHGGAVGVLAGIYLYQRSRKETYLWILDRVGIMTALTGCFIRIGNFFNSEILGVKTSVPWAVIFTRLHDNIPRHPVQIYEALSYFGIFLVLFYLYRFPGLRARRGFLFGCFLIALFTARFFLEVFKDRQAEFATSWAFSMGQLLSVPFILIGIGLLVYAWRQPIPTEEKSVNS
jgi:prolipoprotein diacylglyceryl transferase